MELIALTLFSVTLKMGLQWVGSSEHGPLMGMVSGKEGSRRKVRFPLVCISGHAGWAVEHSWGRNQDRMTRDGQHVEELRDKAIVVWKERSCYVWVCWVFFHRPVCLNILNHLLLWESIVQSSNWYLQNTGKTLLLKKKGLLAKLDIVNKSLQAPVNKQSFKTWDTQ